MHDPAEMPERLERFLRLVHPERPKATVTSYAQLSGGYSRAMARAEVQWDPDDPFTRESLVLRGDPPKGSAMLETDRAYEWALLEHLTHLREISMPSARYFDGTGEHLGTPCIVLEAAPGQSIQARLAAGEPAGDLPDRLADLAAQVHRVPLDDLPDVVERPASWDAFLDSRIALWKQADQAHGESEPFVRYLGAWLDAHRPPPATLTLCHGDFQNSNILVHPDGELQLIDWEFAHIGDPREDLGWYKAYSAAAPPDLVELDPAAFCVRYCEASGLSPTAVNPVTLGYFTILGVIQIFSNVMRTADGWAASGGQGVQVPYNLNAMTTGHRIWLEIVPMLEPALASLEAAS